jgi:electron-transferring-flavoprotein dehydrogenase
LPSFLDNENGHSCSILASTLPSEKTGEDQVSIGFVLDLDYADATSSAHDFLQEFKAHPMVREILAGGEV